jgi:hypothetical protein
MTGPAQAIGVPDEGGRRPRRPNRPWLAALVGLLALSCRGPRTGGAGLAASAERSPRPRSILVQDDKVVIEGRWSPHDAARGAAAADVRVVCVRSERTCREDLAALAAAPGSDDGQSVVHYRVDEWTRPDKAAGKLVASRREGAVVFEIRVSLRGLAAEKVAIDKGAETRWRLE